MWLLVIVDGGLRHFRIGKELCEQRMALSPGVTLLVAARRETGGSMLTRGDNMHVLRLAMASPSGGGVKFSLRMAVSLRKVSAKFWRD
jgi:hypothetical protein